ncbi:MAG: LL-diaminopimelate aminotransferase [Verrucomicrobia bacterium]|jgi:LL-diaminopimelate aminotransferase|nr:LL-diaminopimelate aminotransferase [Verrucomicrobiota bacterium]MBT7068077.1 LL-diaminopimelate aminotransferase [Verrucomicrobiota bacterium]MBT7698656.1 LL-diaminopimelate aminotransferase [Verrucomicrobiota bacterium]
MIRVNPHYSKLQASYLFSAIAKRMAEFQASHPDSDLIKLGIGDVTHALPAACTEAMHKAVDEMGCDATFRGYGPEQGYDFLREAIALNDFAARGIAVQADEVFVSDGAKCDTANIQELFAQDARIAVPDPVYPVYVDTNVMAGRTGEVQDERYDGLVYLDSTEDNHYVPTPPAQPVDLIYLCFPNNPTGATATHAQLKTWVDYAHEHQALILFDAAYEAFVRDDSLPRSIYEIEGADEVAIEFRSFSKTAGFTGTRCAYTVVPKACRAYDAEGNPQELHALWNRRHTTKFNGVSYPVQRAAEAVFSAAGQAQITTVNDGYLGNAALIREKISALGYALVGGENSPYIWIKTGIDSWDFFDRLLNDAAVVTTPGAGFGSCGQGYIRISAFNDRSKVEEAMQRIAAVLGNR